MGCSRCQEKRRRMHEKLIEQGLYTHRELRIKQRKERIARRNKRIKIWEARREKLEKDEFEKAMNLLMGPDWIENEKKKLDFQQNQDTIIKKETDK